MNMELLTSPFVSQGIQGAILAGFLCGFVGPLFVWRRLSLFGNAISHAALTPIAVAQIARLPVTTVLFPFTIGFSFLLTKIEEKGFTELDSVLSIFFSGLMAAGIMLLAYSGGGSAEAVHYLFGDILLMNQKDLAILALVSLLIIIYSAFFWRDLVLMAVNHDVALVEGVAVSKHNYILMALCGLAVTCILLFMGVILATTLMVAPPMIARGFTDRLKTHVVASIFAGVFMSVTGLFISVLTDTSSGPMIAVVGLILFGVSSLFSRNK